jgi:sugar/nucleoside kinase (ribokinase family)
MSNFAFLAAEFPAVHEAAVETERQAGVSPTAAAFPIDRIVYTTGAGDLFAAGFLFGLARGAGYENAGRLGVLAAAEVIQHFGARPQTSLKELAQQNGLPV